MYDFPELKENLFGSDTAEYRFVQLLNSNLRAILEPIEVKSTTITVILFGMSTRNSEKWYLFEFGKHRLHSSLRTEKTKFDFLEVSVDATWSEEENCGRIVSDEYGISPTSVKLQQKFLHPNHSEGEVYVIEVVDEKERKRLEKQYVEQIYPEKDVKKLFSSVDLKVDDKTVSNNAILCLQELLPIDRRTISQKL